MLHLLMFRCRLGALAIGCAALSAAACQPATAPPAATPPQVVTPPPAAPTTAAPAPQPTAEADRADIPEIPAPPADLPLDLTLFATPQGLTMAQRDNFRVRFSARNTGSETIDPALYRVELLVNGTPSVAWMLAIGNGTREKSWYALPPGESVATAWPLGEALFPQPGRYTLKLRQGALTSNELTVVVQP